MISTSAGFQTAIDSNARKLFSRIKINYTDTQLDPTVDATSTDLNYISYPSQMVNGRVQATHKWFELNGQAILDGTYNLLPSTEDAASFNEMGWWSASIADASGIVNASAQIEYSSRAVSSYLIAGDDKLNEYPVDFTAKFYDGVTLVFTDTVTGNTQVQLERVFTQITDIDKVVLNVTKWSEPNTVVKIAEFTTQVIEEYEDDLICNWDVLEEREISNDNSIPVGNISSNIANICLINKDRAYDANNTNSRLFGLVKPNAYIEIEIGINNGTNIEYIPAFKGWATEWDVPEQTVDANTSARDRLNLLIQTSITTQTVVENDTFFDWFETVFNDAGIANTEYNIDTDLQGSKYIVPFGWFDAVSHRRALEILAQGCSATVFVDREGIIQVKSLTNFDGSSVKTYTRSDYTDKNNQPIYQNIANRVAVTTQPLVKVTGQTIYETSSTDPETIDASNTEDFTIFYNESPASDQTATIDPAVVGVTITTQNNYAWGSVLTVQNTNGTAQNFQFKVTGSTYTVQGKKTVTRSDAQSIEDNGLVDFTYPTTSFLQSKDLATEIAENLLASFKDPQRDLTLSFDVGGNPSIELGDTISVTDLYTTKEYKVISQQLNYNGGLGIALKGRV